jgi:hypothetical protein
MVSSNQARCLTRRAHSCYSGRVLLRWPRAAAALLLPAVSPGLTLDDPSTLEDTHPVRCPHCNARLPALTDVCASCGRTLRRSVSSAESADAAASPISDAESSGRLGELERATAASKHERRQLLKHLIAKDDELIQVREAAAALQSAQRELQQQLTQSQTDLQAMRTRVQPARGGLARAAMWLVAAAALAAASAGLFHVGVARPSQERLEREADGLRSQGMTDAQTIEQLRRDVAEKDRQLLAAPVPIPTEPIVPPPPVGAPDHSAAEKALAEKAAALQEAGRRLALRERDVELESQKVLEARKTLDADRLAFEKRASGWVPPAQPTIGGVLAWRGELTVPIAVIITGNKANFGTVSGSLPGRPATMRLVAFDAKITVIEEPGPGNKWSRLYMKVEGKGPVTIFLVWV